MGTRQYIRHNWTKKNIIAEIKRIKKEKGRINPAYLNANYSSLYQAMRQLFGNGNYKKGWYEAVKAAGFQPEAMVSGRLHKWTKESIIAELKRINNKIGRINPGYLDEHHSGLYGAIGRQFGGGDLEKGWNKAVKAAGFQPEAMRVWNKWKKEKIIAELKRIKKEEGRIDINYLYKNYHKLYTAIKRHFGVKK
jgi:hypothetical protein